MIPNNHQEDNHAYKAVTTKLSPTTFLLMSKLCRARGLNIYMMLQMMCDCAVRYMSDKHNLTPEMQKMMFVFEHMEGWENALNLAENDREKVVGEAIYILYDSIGERKGVRAVHVTRPALGDWSENVNIQDILDRLVLLLFPQRHARLMELAREAGCNTLLEFLDYVADEFQKKLDDIELAKPFEDAARAENGREIRYGDRTRRKMRMTMDLFEQQTLNNQDNGKEEEN